MRIKQSKLSKEISKYELRNAVGNLGFTLVVHELASIADDFNSDIASELRYARNRLHKLEKKGKKH